MSEEDIDEEEMSENEEFYRFLCGWGRFNGDIIACKECGNEVTRDQTGPEGYEPVDEYDPDNYNSYCTGCDEEAEWEDPEVDLVPSDDHNLACPDCGERLNVDRARGDTSDLKSDVVLVCPYCWYFGATYSVKYHAYEET